jgi:hypothetical protein
MGACKITGPILAIILSDIFYYYVTLNLAPLFRKLIKRKCGVIPSHFARTATQNLKRNRQHFKMSSAMCREIISKDERPAYKLEVSTSKVFDKIR